jgi:FkbM family methyltransferase
MSGYGNDNPVTNGEYDVIKNFITKDSVIFDIGANIGDWSAQVLQTYPDFQGTLYVFEPMSDLCQLNQRFANNEKVKIYGQGMFSCPCNMLLHVPANLSCLSSIYSRECFSRLPSHVDTKQVKMNSVDNFMQEAKDTINKIDFLKIDTEGAELDVLKGAKQTLKQQKIQTVQFEYGGTYPDAKTTLEQVFSFLTDCGYRILHITEKGTIEMPKWRPEYENYQYSNYLAVL